MARSVRIGMMNLPRVRDHGNSTRRIYEKSGFEVKNVTRRQIEQSDLDEFDMLHAPAGHHVVLERKGIDAVRRFVRAGGGLIGTCAGAHFIIHAGLLKMKALIVRAEGIYHMRLIKRHPIIRGFKTVPRSPEHPGCNPVRHSNTGRLRVHRGNGAFMIAGKGVDVIATYDNDDQYAAIAAGTCGKGRVVAMSCHPWVQAHCGGTRTDRGVERLLKNAALFCAAKH